MKTALLFAVFALALASCTENELAKNFGGSITVDLPPKTKLINATWKAESLWYLYRKSRDGEMPEVTTFKEQSRFGYMEGVVTFKEH